MKVTYLNFVVKHKVEVIPRVLTTTSNLCELNFNSLNDQLPVGLIVSAALVLQSIAKHSIAIFLGHFSPRGKGA